MAAPLIPIRKTNINSGSSIIFVASPATAVDKIKTESKWSEGSINFVYFYKLNLLRYTSGI
jgi:hypothetical protein